MIRPIDIRLNAAHPELPLPEAATYTGSPSTVLIRGVPPNCGRWAITAVFVAATFPDNSTTTRAAVQSANGVWVATIPATATSGRTACGLRILADGVDENGEVVTGYILGVADFAVYVLGVAPAPDPGGTCYQMRYFETTPNPAKKGDVAKIDGSFAMYTGAAWEAFADLSGYATKADATLNKRGPNKNGFSAWECSAPEGVTGLEFNVARVAEAPGFLWEFSASGEYGGSEFEVTSSEPVWGTATSVTFEGVPGPWGTEGTFAFTRTALPGYQLGSDDQHILASEAEAEALRTAVAGKQDALTFDNAPTYNSQNSVKSGGIWSTLWGALTALPTGFSSLYDWCVSQLAGKLGNSGDQTIISGAQAIGFGFDTTKPWIKFTDGSRNTVYVYQPSASGGALALAAGPNPTAGNLAALDANGNPTDSQIPAANVAVKGNIPYDLGTPIVINAASSETVEGETVYFGAATLANRTANIVQVTAATALDELRITFPAATSGKIRDFGLRVEIGTGSAALAAPALVPIAPTGETIKIENNAAETPALADGTATAKGVTLLYFSETAPGVFVVKGEQVKEVA